MGSGSILNGPPKAKTIAPFSVIILISLIPATTLRKGPSLAPTYYRWVITEGSTGAYVSSLTGKGSTLVNLTLEYSPETPITFSLDLCALLGPHLNFRTSGDIAGCGSLGAERQLQAMGLYLSPGSTPPKR